MMWAGLVRGVRDYIYARLHDPPGPTMLSLFFSWSWACAVAALLFLVVWLNIPASLWSFYKQWRAARGVPGRPAHWLLGNLPDIGDASESRVREFRQFVYSNHYKVTRTWVGPFFVSIGVHHPACVREIFKHSKDAQAYDIIKPWLGEGLLIAGGDKWRRNRRLLTPAFHYSILRPYVAVYNNCTETLLGKWASYASSGEPVKLFDTLCLASLDIILQCAFSYRSDCQSSRPPYVEAVRELVFVCADRFLNPLHRIDWIYRLTSKGRRMKKLCEMVHDHADTVINQRREALGLTGSGTPTDTNEILEKVSKSRTLDFLDILLTAVDEDGVGLSHLEIRNEVDTFMFEGHDTTTSAICWTLYLLAAHPLIQEKVREEVTSVLAGRQHLTHEDLKQLSYTQCCIKEAMRLYPPVNIIFRQLDNDLEIEGHRFPKGMHIRISIQSIHCNPDVWSDPLIYDPTRFFPEQSKGRDPYAYLPFSAGSRNCIGQNFALNEEKTVVALIIRRFRLRPHPTHKVEQVSKIVLRATNDIKVFVEPV